MDKYICPNPDFSKKNWEMDFFDETEVRNF